MGRMGCVWAGGGRDNEEVCMRRGGKENGEVWEGRGAHRIRRCGGAERMGRCGGGAERMGRCGGEAERMGKCLIPVYCVSLAAVCGILAPPLN